jgi:putative 4-mercaptohistidine N1-methyltranferase
VYESADLLQQYLLLHYGSPQEILPYPFGPFAALDFPRRSVHETFDRNLCPHGAKALDLGCAVGRASFELSVFCSSVLAVDTSENFISAARQIQRHGELAYERVEEGPIRTPLVARLPTNGLHPGHVEFICGDAVEIALRGRAEFDLVLAANLIDRLPSPAEFITALKNVIKPGGQLVITSPYTWLEQFTPQSEWLCTVDGQGIRVSSLERLKQLLEANFQLAEVKELPFFIREHARKFQWSVAQASRWIRRHG